MNNIRIDVFYPTSPNTLSHVVNCVRYMEQTKNGRGTERHLPKTDESVVRPAG